MRAFTRSLADAPCFRISPDDTNYFAILADPIGDDVPWITVIEIFDHDGKTPPNSHAVAHEMFYVLKGEGIAIADGEKTPVRAGDALVLRPGCEHVVENTGEGKLYCLTTMIPDEEFAALIRNGKPETLLDEDLKALTSL